MLLRALGGAVIACALSLAIPGSAFAGLPPHVAGSAASTDACAICHRAHTASVGLPYRTTQSVEPTGNALIVAPPSEFGTPGFPASNRGDVGLCFTCHGAAGLGSQFDVETAFTLESSHTIAPLTSAFGPSPKMCGSCHDPHGTARTTGDLPYPRLLRSWVDTTTAVFTREEYCEACHKPRPASRFDSVAVYRRTGHYTGMPDPASGTKVRCVACHTAHGSPIAPLIGTRVMPPAAPDTTTVVANDRRQCVACHPDASSTWPGGAAYALSGHGVATTTTPVIGEWPAAGARRRIGECQVCHAPMGRDDGAGGTIAKLLEKQGRALCDTCHQPAGPAVTDLKSLAYPAGESAALELVVGWGPDARSAFAGRTDVYARATSGADPRPLIGPRSYAAPGATGAVAVGDVDGDGAVELVRAAAGAPSLTVLHRDPLLGLRADAAQAVAVTPDFIAIGRFIEPTVAETAAGCGPRPQIAVLDAAAGELRLYENMVGVAWTQVGGPYAVGGTGTGLAAADFTGGPLADLAVTASGADQLLLYTQDGGSPAQLAAPVTVAVASPPRGPSVGDVTGTAAAEIAVCCADGTVRLFDGTGAAVTTFGPIATAGEPWASAVGDILPGTAGNEIAVAVRDAAGPARIAVFTGAGVESDYTEAGAPTALSGSVSIGDIDGDTVAETLLGNAGVWSGASEMSAASVDVFRPDGSGNALVHDATLAAGGSTLAGQAPGLAVADFGAVLPSRHPIDEVAVSHVSTETGGFARHVTCSDCHDSHEASSGVAASAPLVTGDMRGAWGTAVTNTAPGAETLSPSARATRQYEVCFKCHATTADGRTDIASLVNDQNISVHAVEGAAAPAALAGSYVSGWSNGSVLYCSDCHGDAAGAAEAKGAHRSADAPILKAPYTATSASDAALLCYACHLKSTYYGGRPPTGTDGVTDTSSLFFDFTAYSGSPSGGALHAYHVDTWADGGLGLTCDACHTSHGSVSTPHLLRDETGYTPAVDGGTCTNACHGGAKSYTFNLVP